MLTLAVSNAIFAGKEINEAKRHSPIQIQPKTFSNND